MSGAPALFVWHSQLKSMLAIAADLPAGGLGAARENSDDETLSGDLDKLITKNDFDASMWRCATFDRADLMHKIKMTVDVRNKNHGDTEKIRIDFNTALCSAALGNSTRAAKFAVQMAPLAAKPFSSPVGMVASRSSPC